MNTMKQHGHEPYFFAATLVSCPASTDEAFQKAGFAHICGGTASDWSGDLSDHRPVAQWWSNDKFTEREIARLGSLPGVIEISRTSKNPL